MTILKTVPAAAAAAAVAVTSLVLAAPAIGDGNAYKVQVGSFAASAGNQPITGSATQDARLSLSGGLTIACVNSTVSLSSVTNSPTVNVVDVMRFGGLNLGLCQMNGVGLTNVTTAASTLHLSSGVTSAATDVASGHVEGMAYQFRDAGTGGRACRYTISGRAASTYREATRALGISQARSAGGLVVSDVFGCGGAVVAGQPAGLSVAYVVRTSGNDLVNVKP